MSESKPAPVEDYQLAHWLRTKTRSQESLRVDSILVNHNYLYCDTESPTHGVMVGVTDHADCAVTTLTVEQARGLATLLMYQAKLSEEKNNA